MSIKSSIIDGSGGSVEAKVDDSRALCVIENPFPPYAVDTEMRIFRQYFTDDGTSSGSNDMLVDGSSTNVDFYIEAHPTNDRYINRVSFVIADSQAALNKFSNITALTNGVEFFYSDTKGNVIIHDALKSNWDFVRLCFGVPSIGATTDAFRASNVSGSSEGYTPFLDFKDTFGFRWGIKLAAGTKQRITLRIKDDLTVPDQFDAIAYGFDRSPPNIG